MNVIVLGFMVAFIICASADEIQVARCKSTFRSSQDMACSMFNDESDNDMMCTSVDVFADITGYFSLRGDVAPLCITYIFKSDPPTGDDDYPPGIWLFRGVNWNSDLKTCEDVCKFVQVTSAGTNYKHFYVGCTDVADENDENVTPFWDIHTQYDCSSNTSYYKKGKPSPIEVTTTPGPSTTKRSRATEDQNSTTGIPDYEYDEKLAEPPVAAAETTAAPESSSATLFIGIAQGVIGLLGTAIIATSAVVLYLTFKKLKENSKSE